jgi:hypothetical protein
MSHQFNSRTQALCASCQHAHQKQGPLALKNRESFGSDFNHALRLTSAMYNPHLF